MKGYSGTGPILSTTRARKMKSISLLQSCRPKNLTSQVSALLLDKALDVISPGPLKQCFVIENVGSGVNCEPDIQTACIFALGS
jgi:hypothetical protein